jgi:hypothetical protein
MDVVNGLKFVQNLRLKILPKSFRPETDFCKIDPRSVSRRLSTQPVSSGARNLRFRDKTLLETVGRESFVAGRLSSRESAEA